MNPYYCDLITRLSEHPDAATFRIPRDLPELSLEDLAVALQEYPTAYMESIAEADPDLGALVTDRLGDSAKKVTERYAHIGLLVVGFVRGYVRGIVLKDLQAFLERQREADSIEAGHDHGDALTADQLMAGELGLGRSLHS